MAECLGPQCALMVLEWLKTQAARSPLDGSSGSAGHIQRSLWTLVPYRRRRRDHIFT